VADLTNAAYWDQWWQTADSSLVLSSRDPQYGKNGWFLKFIDRHLPHLRGTVVAEVGGAMSYRLLSLAQHRGVVPIVIDYSAAGLEKTKELFAANGAEVRTIWGDFFDVKERFDVVTNWGVLEHQVKVGPFLRHCCEMATAAMIFGMPNMLSYGMAGWNRYSPKSLGWHICHPDESIVEVCEDAGFTCEPTFFGAPMICMTPIERPNRATAALLYAQVWADRLGRVLPYQFGARKISQTRAFVCHRH